MQPLMRLVYGPKSCAISAQLISSPFLNIGGVFPILGYEIWGVNIENKEIVKFFLNIYDSALRIRGSFKNKSAKIKPSPY